MSDPSPASPRLALLLLVSVLFLAAWSTDHRHKVGNEDRQSAASHASPVRSAMAVLMQSTASDGNQKFTPFVSEALVSEAGLRSGQGGPAVPVHCSIPPSSDQFEEFASYETYCSRYLTSDVAAVEAPIPTTGDVPLAVPPLAVLEAAVEAPVPFTVERPIEAPVPLVRFEPVDAPVPPSISSSPVPINILTISSRIRTDYRMTCWCCREYCSTAKRRIAAVGRQTRLLLQDLAGSISRTVRQIDWNARLSSEQNNETRERL